MSMQLPRSPMGYRRLVAAAALSAVLPVVSHASTVVLEWVPNTENPTSAKSTTPSGTITLNITPWTETAISGNGLGPNYFTSGTTAVTATLESISYTAGDGQKLTWTSGGPTSGDSSIKTSPSISAIWATSAIDTPANSGQFKTAPDAGYYMITAFSISGTTAEGAPITFANAAGHPGTNLATGLGNGDVSVNAAGAIPAITDGGYWQVVPLPASLPLLLSGLGLGAWSARRRSSAAS